LEKIVSKDGIDVRLYNRQVFVFTCPYAKFKSVESADYCTGDQETLELEVIGVPPLNVEYKRKILNNGQKETNLKLNRIQPDNFDSPLQQLTNDKSINSSFFSTINGDYSWAATQHLTIQLNLTFDVASSQEFKLHRIIDGAGNEVDLSGMSSQVFTVHGRPVVKFQCSQTHPANLLIGQKSTRLPLDLQGTGPFNLEYKYSSDDHEKEKLYKAKLNHGENTIFASSSGEYDLVSINDKYCKGQVMFPSSCQVAQPEMPYVKVTATPIPSECAGDNEVGMKFVAEFVGAPPYVLEYVVTKYTGRSKTIVEKKREFIDRSRHIFSYLPTSSGEYTYEFTLLDDAHYKKRPTQIPPFKQVVHPQPDAKFSSSSRQSVRTCLGEDMSVDVDLRGTGPFTLSWTIGNQLYSDTVEASKYTIKLPPFERAGHHIVSLVKIEDANGCVKDLEARDFTIDVRRDRPTAFFYTNSRPVRTVEITEGSITSLPIRLTGEGPWKVTYRNVELGDKSKVTKHFSDPNASIDVAAIGHYELLNVTDSICRGDVLGNQYLVKWLDKPTVEILDDQAIQLADGVYERAAVCQGATDSVDIQFSGCNPFYCSYKEFRSPAGHRDFKLIGTEEITSGMKRVRLPLKTGEPGKYRYVFDKLSDQRYTDPFPIKNLQLEQMVHATPTVKFTSKSASKERTLCVGESLDSSDMDPIFMEFTGVAPFAVEIGIRFQTEVQGRVIIIDNIMTKKYQLSLHDELKDSGTYHINLLYVNDANGCASRVPPSDDKKISIKALEIATISPIDSCDDVCVGDTIDFSLQGVSPFTVQYLFNGKPETVKAQSSKLKMIADKPGNITIVSVGDQRNKCRSFPKDVSRYIHEVPSSIVSGGKEIIENIREGDTVQAVVELVGTPPFEFEWRRSRLIWDQNNKRHYKGEVLESHMVYGVEEHRYYINTSVEGIIEVRWKKKYHFLRIFFEYSSLFF
jgi:nucleoporin POM152